MPNERRGVSRGRRQLREAARIVRRRAGRSALASLGVAVAVASLLIAVCMAARARRSTVDEIRHTKDPIVRQFIEGRPSIDSDGGLSPVAAAAPAKRSDRR